MSFLMLIIGLIGHSVVSVETVGVETTAVISFLLSADEKVATNKRSKAPFAETLQGLLALFCCHGICSGGLR